MFSPALAKLLRLHLRAKFRWMFRGGRTKRSMLFLVVGLVVLTAWILPTTLDHAKHGRSDPSKVRVYLPALLLTFCIANLVTAAGERAIAFTPAESDFLFPGPFTRRELLIYKILKSAGSALLSALIFGTFFWNYASAWIASFFACFLALLFLQMLSMAIMLAVLSVSERAQTKMRRMALGGVLIAVAFAMAPIIGTARTRGEFRVARGFQDSAIVKLMLTPFDVFGRIIAAPNLWPAAWTWIGIAGAMVLACVMVVLVLDTQYLDAAAAAGRRRYDLVQRARTRGIATRATNTRLRAPALPRLGGIGPIAWRQLTTAIRHSRGLLTLLMMISIGAGIFVFAQRESGKPLQPTIGVVIWASIMLSNSLRLDFRGDVDLIDTLKALPLAPSTICTGELIAPTLLMSLFHFSVIVMAYIALPQAAPKLLIIAALIVPANFVLFAVENLTFLLFPTRFASASPGDLQGSGRMVLVMFLKMIAFGIVLTVAGAVGAVVFLVSSSMTATIASVTVAMIAEVLGLIAVMALAFVRFDPNIHTPA